MIGSITSPQVKQTLTDRLTDWLTDCLTDELTVWQRSRLADWLTDWGMNGRINWGLFLVWRSPNKAYRMSLLSYYCCQLHRDTLRCKTSCRTCDKNQTIPFNDTYIEKNNSNLKFYICQILRPFSFKLYYKEQFRDTLFGLKVSRDVRNPDPLVI